MTRTNTLFALIIVLASLVSCEKKSQVIAPRATMDIRQEKSAVNEIPYTAELERGLALQFNYINGDIAMYAFKRRHRSISLT